MATVTDSLLGAAFVAGLLSTLHCIGMCGGIAALLSATLPDSVQRQPWRRGLYLLIFNGGRILTYALGGALLGGFSSYWVQPYLPPSHSQMMVSLAALWMGALGLYLAGWFPRFALLERLGVPLWQQLEPWGRRLLPIRTLPQALLYGLIWGTLPCGLVYATLLLTLTTPSAAAGALSMVAFGLGTLPALLGFGLLGGVFRIAPPSPRLRQGVGGVLLLGALVTLGQATLWHNPPTPSWPTLYGASSDETDDPHRHHHPPTGLTP